MEKLVKCREGLLLGSSDGEVAVFKAQVLGRDPVSSTNR